MTTITLPRATVEQALEALYEETAWFGPTPKGAAAIAALRAALAQQAEPVAFDWPRKACPCRDVQNGECLKLGCKWERDPSLVPEALRRQAGMQPAEPVQEPVAQAMRDAAVYGVGISRDGKRIDPASIYAQQAEPVAWAGCGECDSSFPCHDGKGSCLRLPLQQAEPVGTRALIEECLAAFAEELAAWDIDPPLHHVKQAHDKCEAWLAGLAQQAEPVTIERLRDALVASRIIPPAAVEDPDGYDDGVTLFRIEALHRRIT